jgi:hypothetical protein
VRLGIPLFKIAFSTDGDHGHGIRLTEPGKLIQEWSETHPYRKNKASDFYSTDELPEIEAKLATACKNLGIDYALAGFPAAARLAPAVRSQRAMAYVSDRISEVAERIGVKPVASGPNVTLFEPYDEGVMAGPVVTVEHYQISPRSLVEGEKA